MKTMKNITFYAIFFSSLMGAQAAFGMAYTNTDHHTYSDLYVRVQKLGFEQNGALNDPTLSKKNKR